MQQPDATRILGKGASAAVGTGLAATMALYYPVSFALTAEVNVAHVGAQLGSGLMYTIAEGVVFKDTGRAIGVDMMTGPIGLVPGVPPGAEKAVSFGINQMLGPQEPLPSQ